MDAQRIAVDAIVVLTGCDRDEVADFIRRLYLSGPRAVREGLANLGRFAPRERRGLAV